MRPAIAVRQRRRTRPDHDLRRRRLLNPRLRPDHWPHAEPTGPHGAGKNRSPLTNESDLLAGFTSTQHSISRGKSAARLAHPESGNKRGSNNNYYFC